MSNRNRSAAAAPNGDGEENTGALQQDGSSQSDGGAVEGLASGNDEGRDATSPDDAELTTEQLLEQFRNGGGPKGASEIARHYDEALTANQLLQDELVRSIAERDGLAGALEVANEEIVAKNAELVAAKTAVTKAQKAAKVSQGAKAAAPRKFDTDPAKVLEAGFIRARIEAADAVELVFTSAGNEVLGLLPIKVEGDAWADKPSGLVLKEPVTLHGPAHGSAPFSFDGYGLLIDGKPAAYRPRLGGAVQVGPGGTLRLADDIIL